METVTQGIVAFFSVQSSMLDQVPQLGHIPKIFKSMTSRNDLIPKSALQIVQQLAASEVKKFLAFEKSSQINHVKSFHHIVFFSIPCVS